MQSNIIQMIITNTIRHNEREKQFLNNKTDEMRAIENKNRFA